MSWQILAKISRRSRLCSPSRCAGFVWAVSGTLYRGRQLLTVGRLTGRPVLRSGLRQLLLGAMAVAVTFAVGSLIGGHGA
jgi:VIT1/CCC1 family predicted Fe2+/Mn2+ transporter